MDRAWLLATLVAGTIACSATTGNSSSQTGGGGAATTTAQGGGGGSAGSGGAEDPTRYCYTPCLSAADCGNDAVVAYDASHFACEQGYCRYLGCVSTSECEAFSPGYVCAPSQDLAAPQCQEGCAAPADCAFPPNAGPLYDADHYACQNGACHQLGCKSDADCNFMQPEAPNVCRKLVNFAYPWCVRKCSVTADCNFPEYGPAYDVDNYTCIDGACIYTGCNSDEECKASEPDEPGIVCFDFP